MSDIVGIDLGTTNSLIGIMEAGFPLILADSEGERLTPSVVHFPNDGEPLVGRTAARMRVLNPADTIYSVKRFIGLRGDELRESDAHVGYELKREKRTTSPHPRGGSRLFHGRNFRLRPAKIEGRCGSGARTSGRRARS